MASKGPESRLVAEVRAKLRARGWLSWKNHGSQFSQAGLPDIMAVKCGQLLCVECKIGSNKPTAIQRATLSQLAAHGALTAVAYSWADVEAVLSNADAAGSRDAPQHLRNRSTSASVAGESSGVDKSKVVNK